MDKITTSGRRWRPTFSLRSLILLTTLVCLLLAGWHDTKTRGVRFLKNYFANNGAAIEVTAPFVMAKQILSGSSTTAGVILVTKKTYYLWAFGHFFKLPFTTEQVRYMGPAPPPTFPPMQPPSPPADTPPYKRTMPYRQETAFIGELTVRT